MTTYEVLIKNGTLLDGSGASGVAGDLGINQGKIVAIGKLDGEGQSTLDATGCIVSPGFIDTHSHSDFSYLDDPSAWNKLEQGITTELTGNCGVSLGPIPCGAFEAAIASMPSLTPERSAQLKSFTSLEKLFATCAALPLGTNFGLFVGHGNLRSAVVGLDDTPSSPAQITDMSAILAEAMQDGAMGVSYGLIYPPGVYSNTAELVAMAKVAARYQGGFSVHMRNEGALLVESVQEMIDRSFTDNFRIVFRRKTQSL